MKFSKNSPGSCASHGRSSRYNWRFNANFGTYTTAYSAFVCMGPGGNDIKEGDKCMHVWGVRVNVLTHELGAVQLHRTFSSYMFTRGMRCVE